MRLAIASLTFVLIAPTAAADPLTVTPVDAPVQRHFESPAHAYGPGHRGLDYAVAEGSPVRAAGAGRVRFAGRVPGGEAVTIDHGGDVLSTYSLLEPVYVTAGDPVTAGQIIGRSAGSHSGSPGLHLGLRVGGRYVDPAAFLPEATPGDGLRLMPVTNRPVRAFGHTLDVRALTGRTPRPCRSGPELAASPVAPNDNIAVIVGGLGSASGDGKLGALTASLGYEAPDTYTFSYQGIAGPRLHHSYGPQHTFGDIEGAARRLGDLLRSIGRLHPGRAVDLIAHSQGGIVARSLMELQGTGGLPHIEHFVTFATPHRGAPAAEAVRRWDDTTWGGLSALVEASGGGLPPPASTAVRQLTPSSELLDRLGEAPALPGTRYLTVGIANDVIVPADRAELGQRSHTVAPRGLHGHSAILGSGPALGTVFDHLRDAPSACEGWWDTAGPFMGRSIGALEWAAGLLGSVAGWAQPWRL